MSQSIRNSIEGRVRQAVQRRIGSLIQAMEGFIETGFSAKAAAIVEGEQALRGALNSMAVEVVKGAIDESDAEFRKALRKRGHQHGKNKGCCHGRLRSKGRKETTLLTLFGPTRIRQWTASCEKCGRFLGAVDEMFNVIEGLTPACANAVSLAGVTLPYEQAEYNLYEGLGLSVDDNRIKRVVDALGPHAKQRMEDVPGAFKDGLPAQGGRVYVMVDGGRIRMRGGAWREPCIGIILWEARDGTWCKYGISHPLKKGPVLKVLDRCLEQLSSAKDWEVVIIADGAEWIWRWAEKHPRALKILDYYHCKEHVHDTAKVVYGEGTKEAKKFADKIMALLWRGWPRKAVEVLRGMKPRGWKAAWKKKEIESMATYIENHPGMMHYAEDRNKGRYIGSGLVESTCKQLFTMRMKGPGMFWSEEGAGNVMALRTLYISDHWETIWDCDLRMAA